MVLWLAAIAAYAYEDGMNLFQWMGRFSQVLERPFAIGWTPYTLKCMLGSLLLYGCGIALYYSSRENRRPGEEYGSARWGNPKELNRKYMDHQHKDANIILTQRVRLGMDGYITQRNMNVLVVGGSGSGKTRFWLTPQLLQAHSSYVVVDPKGGVLGQVGAFLQRRGYQIKVFNSIDFSKSMHYNPLSYIRNEADILKFVNALITNTKGEGKEGDPFWTKAETLLYCALIAYIIFEGPAEDRNMNTLVDMISGMEVKEDDEDFMNAVDYMFAGLEKRKPDCFAVKQYKKYKLASGKTAKSILVSCGARLAPFDIKELRDLTAYDELELDTLGDEKTALFLIMSDTDGTFNFLISMIYTQMFNLLCEKADDVYGGRLPVHVRCLIDEAANIGQIPNLEKLVATIRSREISACLVLQAKSQLKAIYKDNADTIIGNMDSQIFLGGTEQTTLKDLNAILGKETIDMYNTGQSKGSQESYNMNYQKLGKDLMTMDELAVMDGSKCIVQVRGVRPFLSDKYDLTQHPNYKLTADYDKRNYFDVVKFLSHNLILKADDEYQVIDVTE